MTQRKLPLSAEDPRLLQYWLRGTVTPTLVAALSEGLDPAERHARTGRLRNLAQKLHEIRAAAKREAIPGWEALYSAILRLEKGPDGRVIGIRIEPRALENDDLLLDPGPAPTAPALRASAPALAPIPDDFLTDVFGELPTAASGDTP